MGENTRRVQYLNNLAYSLTELSDISKEDKDTLCCLLKERNTLASQRSDPSDLSRKLRDDIYLLIDDYIPSQKKQAFGRFLMYTSWVFSQFPKSTRGQHLMNMAEMIGKAENPYVGMMSYLDPMVQSIEDKVKAFTPISARQQAQMNLAVYDRKRSLSA